MGYYYTIDSYMEFPCFLSDRCLKARFRRFIREQAKTYNRFYMGLDDVFYKFYKIDGFTACMELEEAYAKHRNADELLAEFISQVIEPGSRCYFEISTDEDGRGGYAIEHNRWHYLSYRPFVHAQNGRIPLHLWLQGQENPFAVSEGNFLVRVYDDIEPVIVLGPFDYSNEDLYDQVARYFAFNTPYDPDDGLYLLEVKEGTLPEIRSFGAGEMEEIRKIAKDLQKKHCRPCPYWHTGDQVRRTG